MSQSQVVQEGAEAGEAYAWKEPTWIRAEGVGAHPRPSLSSRIKAPVCRGGWSR